ncbi:peptidoglycan-binding protein, partial [Paracoccus sp. PXZ]
GTLRAQAGAVAPSRDQQDRAYWQQTGAQGGTRNLRAYLDRYPDGIYAQTARQRLAAADRDLPRDEREDRAWARARQADTVQAYTQYLQTWPRGEHAEQARQRRNRLINQGQIGNGVIGLDTIIRELVK